jgi:hypothetical protein
MLVVVNLCLHKRWQACGYLSSLTRASEVTWEMCTSGLARRPQALNIAAFLQSLLAATYQNAPGVQRGAVFRCCHIRKGVLVAPAAPVL